MDWNTDTDYACYNSRQESDGNIESETQLSENEHEDNDDDSINDLSL